jgi:tetratricopeptide (TPR) repeat protein
LLLFVKLEKSLKFLPVLLSILSVLGMIFAVGFQYESFKSSIWGSSFEIVNPINLASDISWSIAGKVMVNDFFRGVVGVGNESFSIAYNQFKPAVASTIGLGNVSFNSASSEFFTILATRGIVGIIVWILLGIVLLKTFISDLTNNSNGDENLLLYMLEINSIVLFVLSFFVSFSFTMYFLLFVSLLILLVMRSVIGNKEEQFLLKFWAVNVGGVSQDISKTMNSINWFLTGLFILVIFGGLLSLGTKVLSTMYIVRADIYSIEENKKFSEKEDITLEEREAFFNQRMAYFYKSLRYDSSNQIANRNASNTAIEIMNVLSEGYKKASEEEKASILAEISNWKNMAIEFSREPINTSPYTYSNWYTRASVYLGFLSIGLSDYSEDALFALQNAVNLNPLDFESYYRAGQIYMIKEDYDNALAAFNNGLGINGQHVPSLVLSARILNEKGDTENAISYLEAAKKIMEVNKLEDDEMYKSIVDGLNSLKEGTESVEPEPEEITQPATDEFEPL